MEKSESGLQIPTKASDVRGEYDGSREFRPIKKDRILLSGDGVFGPTLQGEGPRLGRPVIFVRLHHCNLKCTWCDAYYTWDKRSAEFWTEGEYVTFEECAERIKSLWPDNNRRGTVVWSGGEPLMHRNQIDAVMELLPYWSMEIETNGTVMPTGEQSSRAFFNCSPKLPSSGNSVNVAIKPKVLRRLDAFDAIFKFVCSTEEDLENIENLYLAPDYIRRHKVYIMPEGVIEEEISQHAKDLLPGVIKHGFNMTPRFQAIFADGAKRGV